MANGTENRQPANSESSNADKENKSVWRSIRCWFCRSANCLKQFDSLITAIATMLLAVITAFLMVIAYWQYLELHNTDATLRFGQRAFIFLDFDFKIATPLPTTKASELIAVGYNFKNFGKSPAVIKKLQGKIEYFPRGYPSLLDIENSPGREILTEIIFPESGPSGFPFNTSWEFRRNELEAAGSGIGHFYFFGRLTYLDVFNEERHTTWCRTFNPSTPLLAAGDCPWNNYD